MPDSRSEPRLSAIERALNLNRIYAIVKAYPQISEVPSVDDATRDEVLAGYGRVRTNRHLGEMCTIGEEMVRRDYARAIEALEEICRAF